MVEKNLFLKYLRVFFILQVVFFGFATLSCLLPNKPIKNNIKKSVEKYEYEKNYPSYFIREPAHKLDNFTDFLILDIIYNVTPNKPFKYVLLPRMNLVYKGHEATGNIEYSINHPEIEPNFNYGRYWLGSSFVYRCFFLVCNLSNLKWLFFLIGSLTIFSFAYSTGKFLGKPQMYLLLLGAIFANYYLFFMSLQFAPVFLITFWGSIILINREKQKKRIDTLFLSLGAITCYFDLLTTPVLSVGIPLLVWIGLQPDNLNLLKKMKKVIGNALLWFVGYVMTWIFKWILVFIFTDYDIIKDVKDEFIERSGLWHGTRIDALKANFEMFYPRPFYAVLILLVILALAYFNKKGIQKAILFLMIAFIPLIWGFATANHIEMHSWFTYRAFWVTISGIFLALSALIRWEDIHIPKLIKN